MYELLPESWLATDGTDSLETQAAKQVSIFPKHRRTPVTVILTCMGTVFHSIGGGTFHQICRQGFGVHGISGVDRQV